MFLFRFAVLVVGRFGVPPVEFIEFWLLMSVWFWVPSLAAPGRCTLRHLSA